ncbi:MAG: response regulator transcription factor [Arcobacteraceae bacterium]
MKILYLEDDVNLSETIVEFLHAEGFIVVCVYDSEEALDKLYRENFDLLIFDVNLDGMNGFELLKSLRDSDINTPTIFTTSRNTIDDLARGYEVGADDYLKKPFALKELLFRIKAIIKREYKTNQELLSLYENIVFNINTNELIVNEIKTTLNHKESELLKLLIKNRNQCVIFDTIFENVWSFDEVHSDMSLRTYIKNLRSIIGKDKIVSIKKVGYKLV